MDAKYSKGPLSKNTLPDIFLKNSAKCPVVTKDSDQADYPDLEKLETEKVSRNRWVESEVRLTIDEAFDIML